MPNFIEIYDDALSNTQCKDIINYFESSNNKAPGMVGEGDKLRVIKDYKDSMDIPLFFSEETEITKVIAKAFYDCCTKYVFKYPDSTNIVSWSVQNDFNLQRYYPGQGYKSVHCEHTSSIDTTVLGWMIYLNTVEDGGTRFTSYDLEMDAVEGRMAIWPAYWTHCHQGIVSHSKTKYIATGWACYIQ